MGLGLSVRALLRKRSIFDSAAACVGREELFAAFRACMRGTPLELLASSVALDDGVDGFCFTIHPAEEPVYVELRDEYAAVSAKTSSAGPGYHAFLTSCLDQIEKRLGIAWNWSGDERVGAEPTDETSYALTRDFPALQADMAAFFKSLFSMIAQRARSEGMSKLQISMPLGFGIEGAEDEVLTQLGPIAFADMQTIAQADGEALERAARSYYPWWNAGFGADFYRGLALNAMWMSVSWSAPVNEEEREAIDRVLAWCDAADRLGAQPTLLAKEMSELRRLAASRESSRLPAEEGIGYRRRFIRRPLTGAWCLSVPGSLRELVEDDGRTVVFWNDELTVRGSSLIADKSEAWQQKDDTVKPHTEFTPDQSGKGYLHRAVVETSGNDKARHVGIVTVWMEREELRPIAERITRSLEYGHSLRT
jgi:hypothetical protein